VKTTALYTTVFSWPIP